MRLTVDSFSETIRVLYGYNDIHDANFSRKELIAKLESCSTWAVIDTLSKLSVLLTNLGVQAVTKQIWDVMLPQDTKVKLMNKAKSRDHDKILLLSDRSLCILTEFARRYCRSTSKKSIDQEYLYQFGECILIANDMATEASFPRKLAKDAGSLEDRQKEAVKNFATFSTREFLFNSSEQFRYTLARSNLIYDLLKPRVDEDRFFDLSGNLEKTLGFSLQDYFLTVLGVKTFWANQDQTWDRQYTNIDPAAIFRNGPRAENFRRVLDYLFQDFEVETTIPSETNDFHQWQYKFFDLRSKPLLRVEGRLYCASMKFIGDLFWNGPYYLGLNHFASANREKLQRYLGAAVEIYVLDLIRDCVGKKMKSVFTSEGHPLGENVIVMRKNWYVVVEVKAGRADTRLQTEAADPAQSPKVAQMLYDGLEQMSARIEELRSDGFYGKITPIIITGGHLPINSVAWENYLGTCGSHSIFKDSSVDFPQVMDLEAIETLCALLKSGSRLGELLREKLTPDWARQDITMFFRKNWFPTVGGEPAHPILIDLNHVIYNNLARGLNIAEETFEERDNWRSVFSVDTP